MSSVAFTRARLFDPASGLDAEGTLLVKDGVIASVGPAQVPDGAETIDLHGAHLFPGFVDMHVHLRTPGQAAKEELDTGLKAAVRGGFTAIGAMPNTKPVLDTAHGARQVETAAEALGLARVHQYGAITLESEGNALASFSDYVREGLLAATDDGRPVTKGDVMLRAFETAAPLGLLIITHSEDPDLAADGVAHFGQAALGLGLPGQRGEAEATMVARDVLLARSSGARLHVAHVSSRLTVDVLRWAKSLGVRVSAEATPHHLTMTDEAIRELGTGGKMNPPLRPEEDRQALLEALRDGTIDAIATDHAPHTAQEKALGWLEAPFGITGMETAFPVIYTDLVLKGVLSLERAVEALSSAPSKILGLSPRRLRVGEPANLTVWDLTGGMKVEARTLATKGKNCPWLGRDLKGQILGVCVEGRWIPV